MVPDCADCTALWDDYAAATHRYFKTKGDLQLSILESNVEAAAALQLMLDAAVEWRSLLREAIQKHEAASHQQAS